MNVNHGVAGILINRYNGAQVDRDNVTIIYDAVSEPISQVPEQRIGIKWITFVRLTQLVRGVKLSCCRIGIETPTL